MLFIEATSMKGEEGFVLTGQLGDVMKEFCADRALLHLRQGAPTTWDIDEDAFEEFHVHVPGCDSQGRSQRGVTMTTALASLLSGRPVKHTVGMTGEVTLQGACCRSAG